MAKTEISAMVSGMGMGMKVLDLLVQEIRAQGGNEEVLGFLTRPRFKGNLQSIGKAIVDLDWRIPASEMRDLAEKAYRKEFEVERNLLEEARNLWWYAPLISLGIPFHSYDGDANSGVPAIPPILRRELHRKEMPYPLLVGKHVVVNWSTADNKLELGGIIDATKIEFLSLAEQRYFDFDR